MAKQYLSPVARALLGFSALAVLTASVCSPKTYIMRKVLAATANYTKYDAPTDSELEQVTDGVYTFRWTWYRNLVVDTPEGLVVTDPFNATAAALMKDALARRFPGKPVHTLIYSHYHLDHVRGGAALAPQRVIAHSKCPEYWARVDAREVLPPTQLIAGDQSFEIGGVRFHLLYLDDTHSDTLYAIHLPDKRVLHTADFGLVRTLLPIGGPDTYYPGQEAAMKRLEQLDFQHWVPSHFGWGTKADLGEFAEFMRYVQQITREEYERRRDFPRTEREYEQFFDALYPKLEARYGSWHGFDEMVVQQLIRSFVAEHLGY